MKVLQINVALNTGSTGRIVEQLGEIIQKEGFESHAAYSRKGNESSSKTIKIGNKVDFYQHALSSRLLDNHGFSSKGATKKLLKIIDVLKPDIIHLHNIHGYYIHVGKLFDHFEAINIPVVWTFHDCWPFTGHCAYFDRVDCEKWKDECFQCPLKRSYPTSWFLDNSSSNFKNKKNHFTGYKNLTIITPSNWLQELVKQSFFKGFDVKVIHNGVNVSVFKPTKSDIRVKLNLQEKIIILGVASIWDSRKGLDDFLKLNDLLEDDFKIILVGLTKKQIEQLPTSVIGIERTENVEELAELYAMADIYMNPTYSDNFPTTNIEALSCGTPVITYNTGGSPEAIDKATGKIVDKGNIKGLLEGVISIIREKDKYNENECRNRALTFFNKDERFTDYIKLYKELLKD